MPDAPQTDTSNPPMEAERPWLRSLKRGFLRRCPRCGAPHIFAGYLKLKPRCANCDLDPNVYRADDGPAYFTILIVGHVIMLGLVAMETTVAPAIWVEAAIWLPLTLGMTLGLLPLIKGAMVGAQWAWDIQADKTR